jgi:hypothetical protein
MAGIIATAIVVYSKEHELLHLLYRACYDLLKNLTVLLTDLTDPIDHIDRHFEHIYKEVDRILIKIDRSFTIK